MVTARSQPECDLRQLIRAPEKLFRHVCQPLGQGDALLVRHLAALAPLDVLQEGALDRPRIGLRQDLVPLAVAFLFFGGCESHRPVTLPALGAVGVGSISGVTAKGAVRPMSVLFNGDQLEVSAVLGDAESVDRLIKALEANKPLLPEKPEDEAAN